MKFKFLDLNRENSYFYSQGISRAWVDIRERGVYLFGEETKKIEEELPKKFGYKYGVSVGNATDAITIVLRYVLQKEIGLGAKVIIPSFTAVPTAAAARMVTENIFYAEIDESFTIDFSKLPDFKDSVIIPVDLFGNQVDREKLYNYAERNNSVVIHDLAQAAGNMSEAHFSILSFYPTKNLSAMGDGGMVLFNEEKLLNIFKEYRFYGFNSNGEVKRSYGLNSRMDEFQAAVVNVKLDNLKGMNFRRNEIAARYKKNIKGIKVNDSCVYHQFPILWEDRGFIEKELINAEIPYMIHYPFHVCDFLPLRGNFKGGVDFRVSDKILSLPINPFLKEEEITKVEEFLYKFKEYEYIKQ